MAYVTIDGNKYEKELIDLATKHTTGKGEGKLSKDEDDLVYLLGLLQVGDEGPHQRLPVCFCPWRTGAYDNLLQD